MTFRLPNSTERISIVGKTGTGKSVAAAWQLSERNFDSMPWIVFDFKRDELLNKIPYTRELSLEENPPTEPGLYIVHPQLSQEAEVEEYLNRIWEQENTGIFIDEGYMIPSDSAALNACLTQGRSKHIPMIILTQRPVSVSRFVFSEADHFQYFWLNDERDRKILRGYFPQNFQMDKRLPRHWSTWYNVGDDELLTVKPVPDKDRILARFHDRLRVIRQEIEQVQSQSRLRLI